MRYLILFVFLAFPVFAQSPNTHPMGTAKHAEHDALFALAPHAQATHTAQQSGLWSNPATWGGSIPDAQARVLVPAGAHVTYDVVLDTRLFTVRVDGHLEWVTDADTRMVVDTLIVDPAGTISIGTEASPVTAKAEIIVANNGDIDVAWDTHLLSRGVISHGTAVMHGMAKTTHLKVAVDPMAGNTSLTLAEAPTGWEIGDTIVLAATRRDGTVYANGQSSLFPSQSEVLTITDIQGDVVSFTPALTYDHDSPRPDLKTSVANYSRNIVISSEGQAAVEERGHVMFMHSDNVDVRFVEFRELGRTNKAVVAAEVSQFAPIESASNVKGRYSVHVHRAGADGDPATLIGNAVFGSPGWGFVHHDSNAVLRDNACYGAFGACYVAESGNETGAWTSNIAIFSRGIDWNIAKNVNSASPTENFDLGRSGDGFWFQSRLVEASNNVAADVNIGFTYFHRGAHGDGKRMGVNADHFAYPGALTYNPEASDNAPSILHFSDNETFAARAGLEVVKAGPQQGHDVHSHMVNFTAWQVKIGAHLEYTGHYILEGFDLINRDIGTRHKNIGIDLGTNVQEMTIINPVIDGFVDGVSAASTTIDDVIVIDPTMNVTTDYIGSIDARTAPTPTALSVVLNSTLYSGGDLVVTGTKTDSLGPIDIPTRLESLDLTRQDLKRVLARDGFYTGTDGKRYFVLNAFYTDRFTAEVYRVNHLFEVADDVLLQVAGTTFEDALDSGPIDQDAYVVEAVSMTAPPTGPTVQELQAELDALYLVLDAALAREAQLQADASALRDERDAAISERDTAIAERDALAGSVASLQNLNIDLENSVITLTDEKAALEGALRGIFSALDAGRALVP